MTAFDADFFENAAVVINGKGVEYADGLIRLTGDVESATVTFATESATLELTLRNYTAPEKPVVPETEEGFSYRFFEVGQTATVTEILENCGIISSYYNNVSVSDEKLVTVEKDALITKDYFDQVTLTLSLSDGTEVEIILSNPAPVEPGTEVSSDDGSFSADAAVPAGTTLSVEATAVDANTQAAVEAKVEEVLGENAQAPVYFDISLVGPQGEKVEAGAAVTIKTNIALPLEEDKVTKVTSVKVFHVTVDGTVETLDATYALGENGITSVSFRTDGFSVFGISYTVDFVASEVEAAWSWPGQGSYKIADILAEIGVEGTVESVTLERTVDEGGSEKALYLDEKEDGWYLVSEEAFQDTFVLKIVADGVTYTFTVTDLVYTSDESRYPLIVGKLQAAANAPITGRVQDVVELASRQFSFTQPEQDSILDYLIRGGDMSLYGLSNAVTRASQDIDSYDRATEMESIGWDIVSLSPAEWKILNNN